jgi:hypothetical protein
MKHELNMKTEFGQEMKVGQTSEGLSYIKMGEETRFFDLEHMNQLVMQLQNMRKNQVLDREAKRGNSIIDKFMNPEQARHEGKVSINEKNKNRRMNP